MDGAAAREPAIAPSTNAMIFSPLAGAACLLRGFGLITRPGLKRFVVMPLMINAAIFAAAIWLAVKLYSSWLAYFIPRVPGWLAWLAWLFWALFAAAVLLIVFYGFMLIANIIAAPFNDALAGRIEEIVTGRPAHESGRGLVKDILADIGNELSKTAYFAIRALLLLALGLILQFFPPLNVAVPPLWFLFGAWMFALEYSDYPLARHGLRFRRQRRLVRARRFEMLGFGVAVALLTLVPLVNFLVMPAAVAGATLLWTAPKALTDPV
jgi:CysZ protein